ncbi:MAG: hypothetical protein ACTH1D_09295 [Mycobacteriaceae bacterium]|uniref:hypothetical protein n=1 Tax=Corynebacterium sp. TaxID=1720 RepID=UPI003F9CFC92
MALVVDADSDWIVRSLFGIYMVFDGRVQACAGTPLVQVKAGQNFDGKAISVTLPDGEEFARVVEAHGAELDGAEKAGVRSYQV